ncbi:hypothetical protein AmDm5_1101 [Acetobacter malorum]|nr:hypothetical protein AmDm5_1101 [Acetobacter malorum]
MPCPFFFIPLPLAPLPILTVTGFYRVSAAPPAPAQGTPTI